MISGVEIPGYELIRPLGSGGMSTVYLAVQRSLDRKVAIKVMRRSLEAADTRQLEKRFLLEGRMMAKLPHRNIVAVYDIVSTDAIAYIAMEYLSGGSLTDRMRNGLSLAEAVAVVVQIAGALEHAHGQNVVHRDLKPANIMFRENGTPVLTDFGIARYQDSSATKLTQTGMLVGTPTYMSPEQINADNSDGRSDLYSLGILFYELLTGHPPFRAETPIAVLMAHLTQPPPPLPAELSLFQEIIDRMLAKNRDDRFANMREFSQFLRARFVESDTLQMRLRVDPNATTSEQLRALGFSNTPSGVSRIPSDSEAGLLLSAAPGATRDSMRSSRLSSPGQRKPTAPAPPDAVAAPAVPAARRSIWAALAAAAVLALAIGAWFMFREGHRTVTREEQRMADLMVEHAQLLVAKGDLVTPPDENAFTYAQEALQKDGTNDKARALIDGIASALLGKAQQALAAGDLDGAESVAGQLALVRPGAAEVATVKQSVADARRRAQRDAQLATLERGIEGARKEGRLFGENSAYALANQALALTPDDAAARARVGAIVEDALAPARRDLAAGQLARAAAALDALEAALRNEPAFVTLSRDVAAAAGKAQAEKDVAALLARGSGQLRAGRFDEPPGDNAYESFGELGKRAAGDPRVTDFGAAIGRALLADARKLDASGGAARALERLDLAAKVAPDLAEAGALRAQIEQRLGARAAKLAQSLGAARQAIAEQRFVAPAADDAYTKIKLALDLDPANADAKQLLAELPRRVADAAAAKAGSDASAAVLLVEQARKIFPEDKRLADLAGELQVRLAAAKAADQSRAVRERIAAVLAAPAPTLAQLRAATTDLATQMNAKPVDKEVLPLRSRLIEAIGSALRAAPDLARFDALAEFQKEQQPTLGADPGYPALAASVPTMRAALAQAEAERAEARRGTLVLNAYPWAKVESVLDANRQPVALPAEAVTPLVLALPAGSYVVTFRHPEADGAKQRVVTVEAKKRVAVNAAFTTISAKDYFSRAGW